MSFVIIYVYVLVINMWISVAPNHLFALHKHNKIDVSGWSKFKEIHIELFYNASNSKWWNLWFEEMWSTC